MLEDDSESQSQHQLEVDGEELSDQEFVFDDFEYEFDEIMLNEDIIEY